MNSSKTLPAADYAAIKARIDRYIGYIVASEGDEAFRAQSIEKLEVFLRTLHSSRSGLRDWFYRFMDSAVTGRANSDLESIWLQYQADSVALQDQQGAPPAVRRGRRGRPGSIQSDVQAPPYFNNQSSSHFSSQGSFSASVQGSPHSSVSGHNSYRQDSPLFHLDTPSANNSPASSHHSLRYPYMAPGTAPPHPAQAQPQQPQFYAAVPYPRGPIGQQGQGMYYAGPGASYPPQSGPYAGQGAHQGQGGPYYQ
ncbi:hypothetical protein C8R46DRAFT_1057555 [Mycena filopes]|nr:hypothetical protein C8R46DRAFT_1057555 [Mycena filopes]